MVMRIARQATVLGAAAAICAATLSCNDAEHDLQVSALGPEDPAVPAGPDHRPGQPCLVCHGGAGPAHTQFSVAGTVYAFEGSVARAVGAIAQIEDVDGVVYNAKTNTAGNFFVSPSDFTPHYPTYNQVMSADGSKSQGMVTLVNREGSCGTCHVSPRGPDSQGPVYLALPASGGMP